MPLIKVNGIDIYFEIHGEGEPLLIINGLSLDLSETEMFTRPLADNFKVITLDNRGAGRSSKPDEPYTIELMANDVIELMKSVHLSKANVLGISMGGRIALELTLSHPELVNNLILVSTSARTIKTWRRGFIFSIIPRLPILKGKYPQPYYAFKRQRQASSSYDCTSRLSEISKRTLIMRGNKDKLVTELLVSELYSGVSGSKLESFNGGHLLNLALKLIYKISKEPSRQKTRSHGF